MYFLDFAYKYYGELSRNLFRASTQKKNTWYFQNFVLNANQELDRNADTLRFERQILGSDNKIIGYFSAEWKRPVDTIENFRVINFSNGNHLFIIKGLFDFMEYLFLQRGCRGISFSIPEQSLYLTKLTNKFIDNYFGHKCGLKHNSLISYSGIISNELLYEITREEYIDWKNKK